MKKILFTYQDENDTVFIGSGEETKKSVISHLEYLMFLNSSLSYGRIISESYDQVSRSNCKYFKFRIDNAGMMLFEPYTDISPVLEYIQKKTNI